MPACAHATPQTRLAAGLSERRSMGERFLLCRMSENNPRELGRRALAHAGREAEMRASLAAAVAGLFVNGLPSEPHSTDALAERLVGLAELAATARSPVERDPRSG